MKPHGFIEPPKIATETDPEVIFAAEGPGFPPAYQGAAPSADHMLGRRGGEKVPGEPAPRVRVLAQMVSSIRFGWSAQSSAKSATASQPGWPIV